MTVNNYSISYTLMAIVNLTVPFILLFLGGQVSQILGVGQKGVFAFSGSMLLFQVVALVWLVLV